MAAGECTVNTGQMGEDHSQDHKHRAEDLLLPDASQAYTGEDQRGAGQPQTNTDLLPPTRKARVKWSSAADKRWGSFNRHVNSTES